MIIIDLLGVLYWVIFPLLIALGIFVCWKRRFIEGIIFFLLFIFHELYNVFAFEYWEEFYSFVMIGSRLILLLAFAVLVIGLFRQNHK